MLVGPLTRNSEGPMLSIKRRLQLNSSFILAVIIALFDSSSSFAWEVPQTPPIDSNGVTVMPTDFTGASSEMAGTAAKDKQNPPRVRIGLRLTPYRKVVYSTEIGTETKFKPDSILSHTLRARMDRPNHFFVSDFHIETVPLTWDKAAGIYKMRLTFFRRFGASGQIEEAVGKVELGGHLKGQKGLYVLEGIVTEHLKNKRGQPVVDITAGYTSGPKPGANVASENASRANVLPKVAVGNVVQAKAAAPKAAIAPPDPNVSDDQDGKPVVKRGKSPARPLPPLPALTDEVPVISNRAKPAATPARKNSGNGWQKM
jgi:hypothetical protein